jgi:hypothetical protein
MEENMDTASAPQFTNRKWYEIWWDVWRHPGTDAFRRMLQEPNAKAERGFIWVAVVSLIEALLISLVSGIFFQNAFGKEFPGLSSALSGYLICTVIVTPVASVISLAILAGIYHLIAKLFGASGGEWGQLVFSFSAVQAPQLIITGLVGVLSILISLPVFLGQATALNRGPAAFAQGMSLLQCFLYVPSIAVSIYSIVLYVCGITAVENLDTGRSILTYFIPVIVAILLACCVSVFLVFPALNAVR